MTDRRQHNQPFAKERRGVVEDSLEVSTAAGSVKATGQMTIIVALFLAIALVLGIQAWTYAGYGKDRAAQINKQIDDMKDAINEQTYILTLTTEERTKLRLDMPESLRRKIAR